jgi:hypothetical protein
VRPLLTIALPAELPAAACRRRAGLEPATYGLVEGFRTFAPESEIYGFIKVIMLKGSEVKMPFGGFSPFEVPRSASHRNPGQPYTPHMACQLFTPSRGPSA